MYGGAGGYIISGLFYMKSCDIVLCVLRTNIKGECIYGKD